MLQEKFEKYNTIQTFLLCQNLWESELRGASTPNDLAVSTLACNVKVVNRWVNMPGAKGKQGLKDQCSNGDEMLYFLLTKQGMNIMLFIFSEVLLETLVTFLVANKLTLAFLY